MKSLRGQLVFFWVLMLTVGISLAVVMLVLFRQSAGVQIDESARSAAKACEVIAARYAKAVADRDRAAPQVDVLTVLLQLVLIETPRVEGGVWSRSGGFIAYAFPTYEGSSVKRDVPEAERSYIAAISETTARTQRQHTDVVRGSREALVVAACPLLAAGNDVVAWTMTRTPTGVLDAQESLRIGLGLLLTALIVSAIWLGRLLNRAWREVEQLETRIDDVADLARPLPATGVSELDRIVGAVNRSRQRSAQMQDRLRESERTRARDQRLATLGRMTGGVAHEIRNPIAAMRLRAENALAASDADHGTTLRAILGQIERLDALVQKLLAVVQPINLQLEAIDVDAWLAARLAAFQRTAAAKGVTLDYAGAAGGTRTLRVDAVHLGRAVDNLLDNAVRHARSVVSVVFEPRTDEALIRITDDGEGVPGPVLDQLFEPFSTGRSSGTGLGLAMAREVVLAHGGDLRHVVQPAGACFELSLPWRTS